MKKNAFVKQMLVLAVVLILILGGCGKAANDSPSSASGIKSEEKAEYAAVVEITINPHFRVYLDKDQKVLRIECMNKDAEEVCKNLSVVGEYFDNAFGAILEESVSQGFLCDGKEIEVTVVESISEIYAPDIVQHSMEIAEDTIGVHKIDAKVAVEMSEKVIEEQYEIWNEKDQNIYAENPPATHKSEESFEDDKQQEAKECKTCSGSGNISCQVCDAKGRLDCGECNATGILTEKCENCENGLVLCDACQGNYDKVKCDTCGGDGLLEGKCPYCKGTGKCVNCGGSGEELNDDGQMGSCHACGGTGLHTNLFYGKTQPCYGAMPCNSCPGTGYTYCHSCYTVDGVNSEHPGYKECPSCDGGIKTENCPACDGGIAVCGNCEGSGQTTCPDCGGSGHL